MYCVCNDQGKNTGPFELAVALMVAEPVAVDPGFDDELEPGLLNDTGLSKEAAKELEGFMAISLWCAGVLKIEGRRRG